MVELAHDFYFVDEGFLPLVLAVGALLRKRLHCVLLPVLVLDHQVDSREVALADLLDRLEQLMEAALVQPSLEVVAPQQQLLVGLARLQDQQLLEALKLEAVGLSIGLHDVLAVLTSSQQFEDELKVELYPEV